MPDSAAADLPGQLTLSTIDSTFSYLHWDQFPSATPLSGNHPHDQHGGISMILARQPYGAAIKTTQNQDTYGRGGTKESAPRGQEPDEVIVQAETEIALNWQSVCSVPDNCLVQPGTIVHRQTE